MYLVASVRPSVRPSVCPCVLSRLNCLTLIFGMGVDLDLGSRSKVKVNFLVCSGRY